MTNRTGLSGLTPSPIAPASQGRNKPNDILGSALIHAGFVCLLLKAMDELTRDAVAAGAKLLTGRQRIGDAGNFWQPTVLADVPLQARVFNEKPFGPMAAIRSFDQLKDAIAEANRLPYRLAGYAFTRSLANAALLARRVEVGMLWINTPAIPSAEMPFGGLKDSGYGSEGGPEAIEAYLNVRSIAVMNV